MQHRGTRAKYTNIIAQTTSRSIDCLLEASLEIDSGQVSSYKDDLTLGWRNFLPLRNVNQLEDLPDALQQLRLSLFKHQPAF